MIFKKVGLVFVCFLLVAGSSSAWAAKKGVTFSFPKVKEKSFSKESFAERKFSFKEYVQEKEFFQEKCELLLRSTPFRNTMYPNLANGFMATVLESYNEHIPLVLRPDDVWMAIMGAFGHYVNTHPEQMRPHFVLHEGKKELEVFVEGSMEMSEAGWGRVMEAFNQAIVEHTVAGSTDWMVGNFSTSTERDQLVSKLFVMGAMQSYFDYTANLTCGLPKVTLLGTLKDWKLLRKKAKKIGKFGGELKEWSKTLGLVLDQFVASYEGNVDKKFWKKVVTDVELGSGSSKYSGWFLAFSPFNKKGKYQLNPHNQIKKTGSYGRARSGNIVDVAAEVPVKIIDNGAEPINTIFYGGPIMPKYSFKKNELKPYVGWAMAQVKKDK